MTASSRASQIPTKSHHHVELFHLADHVCQELLGCVEPARRILGSLDAASVRLKSAM
jgi:hypothetical protein